MYLVDLVKRLSKKENIPIIIYLVLNMFLSGFLIYLFPMLVGDTDEYLQCFGMGFVLYLISVAIALSPIGEFIIRLQTGCHKIKRVDQINYIEPIFREVYEKAKATDANIPDDVQLFINEDESANAFATGRKTVCITAGLLKQSPDEIKAILGHEFGHIAHKDTDIIMLISVGNLIVSGFILIVRAIISLIFVIGAIVSLFAGGKEGVIYSALNALGNLLVSAVVGLLVKAWTKFGVILCMKSSRGQEFLADEFSFNLGYGNSLCAFLDSLGSSKPEGLFATLASSHPSNDDRIGRLQELGAQYRTSYTDGNNISPIVGNQPIAAVSFKARPAMGFAENSADITKVNNEATETMNCPSCGKLVAAESMFCNHCGTKIEVPQKMLCPKCGKEVIEKDSIFCEYCGTKLN